MKVSVSYSGGKDSLAVLQLVSESLDDYEIMFADTGLEFPETIENVKQVVEHYGKKTQDIKCKRRFLEFNKCFWPSYNGYSLVLQDLQTRADHPVN
ncbi:phosphoadenosine phosphosulfate reductase domain-containing protein [Methanosarcina barkeri]|uniref:phosphoadenosine phosphosulfate reductase domain-containing protein n=1 Tax=Methanosarcina barkeri TaxID=2208 RepID=UPI00311FD77A